ncbi:MAG: efflux RND transporter permease subunit [Planctomycetes bacterium]|nr:efflux RND transporter permease subunit [Planctomycetota bacterium]
MLRHLIAWSLGNARTVLVIGGVLLAFAGWLLTRLPIDVFPELNAPTVVVLTEAPGLGADAVETQVTVPLEGSIAGVPGLRRVRSSSALGLSIVWAEFDWGEDVHRARQAVGERVAAAREFLPEDTHAELAPISSITGEIMLLSVSSPDGAATPLTLRGFAEYELRNHLLAIPGVSQVVPIGGELPEYQVHCRAAALAQHQVTVGDVMRAAAEANATAGAGYLPDVEGREVAVATRAQVRSADDIASTIVAWRAGVPVTIGAVAEVRLGPAPVRGTASFNGHPAVVLSLTKSPGVNTLEVTSRIDAALDRLALPPGVHLDRHAFRQADFIGRSIDNLIHVLRDAAIIVAGILVLFLLNVRTTIITLVALPLSLAVAVVAFWWSGLTLNVMTLGGLAVAIGGLVDDAIIDVENVHRRLRERPGDDASGVVLAASNEIRPAMVMATVIIVLVFAPLLALSGLEGRFFRPLGIAFIVATLASLVVALTVTPALCWLLLGRARDAVSTKPHREGPVVRWLHRGYHPVLRWSVLHRRVVLISAAALTVASLAVASTFGTSFLPAFREGTFTVFLMAPPGTSLAESDRVAQAIERGLIEVEGVSAVTRRTGRAERDEHAEPVWNAELDISLAKDADPEAVRAGLDAQVRAIPGMVTMVGQPIEHRLSHILSGTPAAIAINVFGDDLDRLRASAKQIEAALRSIPGTRDIAANREILITSMPIEFKHADLGRAGLTPADAARQVRAAISGEHVATVNDGIRRYELAVRLHPDDRASADGLGEILLRGQGGAVVRLREVARIGEDLASYLIAHEQGRRKAVVSCNVDVGNNLGHLVAKVQAAVDPIVAAAGQSVHYGGQFEAQQEASRTLLWAGLAVIALVWLLLAGATGSTWAAGLVLVNLPLALIGGIVAVFLAESANPLTNLAALFGIGERYIAPVLSIASLVGFITLFGIAVRNGILLVNQFETHRAQGMPLHEAVTAGARDRLIAILMTALTAALGLLPLAIAAGRPGSEILAPLAVVVLGGLVSSTALNLVVVPAGYVALAGILERRATSTPSSRRTP